MEIPIACPGMTNEGETSEYGLILTSHCWADDPIPTVGGVHYTMCSEQVDPADSLGLCKRHSGLILKPRPKQIHRWVQPDVVFYDDEV